MPRNNFQKSDPVLTAIGLQVLAIAIVFALLFAVGMIGFAVRLSTWFFWL